MSLVLHSLPPQIKAGAGAGAGSRGSRVCEIWKKNVIYIYRNDHRWVAYVGAYICASLSAHSGRLSQPPVAYARIRPLRVLYRRGTHNACAQPATPQRSHHAPKELRNASLSPIYIPEWLAPNLEIVIYFDSSFTALSNAAS